MKKDNKKKKKKKIKSNFGFKKLLILLIIVIAIVVGLYFFLTAEDEESKLSLIEKQWIEKNKDTLINIEIPNNLSVIGSNGEGLLFKFLNKVEEETELSFNKISYNYPENTDSNKNNYSLLVLKNSDTLNKNDILVIEDNFVLVGKENKLIEDIASLSGATIGVLDSDKTTLNNNYKNININFRGFSSIENLFKAMNEKIIDYIVVPRYAALDNIVKNNYYIKYEFNNLSNKIVFRFTENERLNKILSKYLEDWKEKDLRNDLEKSLMNFYEENSKITDIEKNNLVRKVYTYGYVKGTSYNEKKNDKLYGLAGEYINTLKNMANMEFKIVEYSNKEKLIEDIKNNKVDIAFIDFDFNNENVLKTEQPFLSNMVVLSKNIENINDKNGLTNRKLYLYKENFLYSYIKNNINGYTKLIKNINTNINDGLLVLDEIEYNNYSINSKLTDYKQVFIDTYSSNYHYVITNNNETLYNLFNFILNNTSYNEYKNMSIKNLNNTYNNENNFKYIYTIIVAIILIPIVLLVLVITITKSSSKLKFNKKENVLKYNDMLTSLKNRNYLNEKMEEWDELEVYPRTVIIADLNNLKYVNDNYGTEEGNNLIKKAAAVLINTQLEKSEIVRTDGNEFLIFLVGYNKNQVNAYKSKLAKEFEKLPYSFGAAIGSSMIEDEIKTVEDAINEASIDMRKDKEENYR